MLEVSPRSAQSSHSFHRHSKRVRGEAIDLFVLSTSLKRRFMQCTNENKSCRSSEF